MFLDAKVVDSQAKAPCVVVERRPDLCHHVIEGEPFTTEVPDDADIRVVLLGIGNRVEAEHHRLLPERQSAEQHLHPFVGVLATKDVDPRRKSLVSPCQLLVFGFGEPGGFSVLHRPEVDVVGIRVDDTHLDVSFKQKSLKDHAQGVRLSRARLPAEKRVASESCWVQLCCNPTRTLELTERHSGRPDAR